jgi:hypothetical protein
VEVVIKSYEQSTRREKLTDCGGLPGVVWNAFNEDTDLEGELCGLSPRHASPWDKMKLHSTDSDAIVKREGLVTDGWRWQQQQEAFGREEVDTDIMTWDSKPSADSLLHGVTHDVVPWVIIDGDGDQSTRVVLILHGCHVGRVSSACLKPINAAERGARPGAGEHGKAVERHFGRQRGGHDSYFSLSGGKERWSLVVSSAVANTQTMNTTQWVTIINDTVV